MKINIVRKANQSKYDPIRGRYVTDAFGEEAVGYIDRHAADENPFFLYLAYTTPHTPFRGQTGRLGSLRRHQRSDATHDCRDDLCSRSIHRRSHGGAASRNIDDNTIVVFVNDQGSTFNILNPPYAGFKGTMFEGGIGFRQSSQDQAFHRANTIRR